MAWTQAKHYHHEVMLHAANECRMWFTVGSFPGGEAVPTVEMRGGGDGREILENLKCTIYCWHTVPAVFCSIFI